MTTPPVYYAVVRAADGALLTSGPLAAGDVAPDAAAGETVLTFATAPSGLAVWDPRARVFVGVAPRARRAPTLSKLDFRTRFTITERVALELARRGLAPDGTTTIAATTAAQLAVLAEDLAAAGDIDVTDPLTVAGVDAVADALVALGVVDAAQRTARVADLLAPPGTYAREQSA